VSGQGPPMRLHLLNIRGHFMTNLAFSIDTAGRAIKMSAEFNRDGTAKITSSMPFLDEFNNERPHEALAMKCPAEVYTASTYAEAVITVPVMRMCWRRYWASEMTW
jgi:hypothetical protein